MTKRVAVAVVLAVVLAASGASSAQSRSWGSQDSFVPGELLVKFKPSLSQAAVDALIAQHGATTIRILRRIGVHHLATSMPVLDAVRLFQGLPEVEYAEPNFAVRPQGFRNDTNGGDGLHNTGQGGGARDGDIGAPEA